MYSILFLRHRFLPPLVHSNFLSMYTPTWMVSFIYCVHHTALSRYFRVYSSYFSASHHPDRFTQQNQSSFSLHCSIISKYSHSSLTKNTNIPLNTPLPNILGIQLHHFLKVRDIAPSTHLPQSGQSRSE